MYRINILDPRYDTVVEEYYKNQLDMWMNKYLTDEEENNDKRYDERYDSKNIPGGNSHRQ